MRHLKISSIPILLVVFFIAAFADEQRQFDVSHAWFKPELLVNDQPALCEPIFKGYVAYFVSPGAVNPLKPISARDWEKYTPGVLTETIRELEWGTVGEEEKGVRLAQWRQDGQYFGVVERSQAIGWRPPTYHYYLIDTPLSDTDMAHGTNEHYGQGVLAYLHETQTQGVFDVIYEADARFENYHEYIFVQVANLYVFNQRVYIALTANQAYESGETVYLIASVTTPRQVKLVCKFTTVPSANTIRHELEKISSYKAFEDVVVNIMGGGGDCGTLNAPARALVELREGLDTLIFRPWTSLADTDHYDLASWGYSGAWN